KSSFPDYGKKEEEYADQEYAMMLMTWSAEVIKYCFHIKSLPIFVSDWTGQYNHKHIPSGRLENIVCNSKLAEQFITEIRAKDPRYDLMPVNCSDSCDCATGDTTSCACAKTEFYQATKKARINSKGFFITCIGVGAAGVDGLNIPLTDYERQIPNLVSCTDDCNCGRKCLQNMTHGCRCIQAMVNMPGCGWDMRAGEDIPRGVFISSMAGENVLISEEGTRDDRMFYIRDKPIDNISYTADRVKNDFCYNNHSCGPTLLTALVYHERDPLLPRPAHITRQFTPAGCSLTWDYYPPHVKVPFDCGCGFSFCRK
ncbi:hypothetical protein PFISCL1PPCAC_27163, partial [Pristionchus fissidentatus]